MAENSDQLKEIGIKRREALLQIINGLPATMQKEVTSLQSQITEDLKKFIENNQPISNESNLACDFYYEQLVDVIARAKSSDDFSRRDFLHLSSVITATGLLGLLFPRRSIAGGLHPFGFFKQSGGASAPVYSNDVFSSYLYTGNGTSQTITNGIDLATKGGLVWIKDRGAPNYHSLFDTVRNNGYLETNTTAAVNGSGGGAPPGGITPFNSNGFTLADNTQYWNSNASRYVSWTFRKTAKFFDVVTYTGDGTANKVINHNLGAAPGMIITKRIDSTGSWATWHRTFGLKDYIYLESTAAKVNAPTATDITVTNSSFTIGTNQIFGNGNGWQYVAYLFAHDTSADGLIQCGTFTSTVAALSVNLGWEPQYLLYKRTNSIDGWNIADCMRGWQVDRSGDTLNLQANASTAENAYGITGPTSTGFTHTSGTAGDTYIYMAIRRPNKVPTSGTEVFQAAVVASTTPITYVNATFAADLVLGSYNRSSFTGLCLDRLRGRKSGLLTNSSAIEDTFSYTSYFDDMTGVNFDEGTGNTNIWWMFKRAKGFFDIVCYTGDGTGTYRPHGLGAVPELIIYKKRSNVGDWIVHTTSLLTTAEFLFLNRTDPKLPNSNQGYQATMLPTLSTFYTEPVANNVSGNTYVVYMFATLAGISKVGNYTGNGTTQTIACGFTTGARFLLIRRTDSGGNWWVWDTTRGIASSANDPHLSLNNTSAEVTTDDSIDPDTSGFIVKQVVDTNINVSGGTYIFLAIA